MTARISTRGRPRSQDERQRAAVSSSFSRPASRSRGDPRAGGRDRAETSIIGPVLTAGTAVVDPALGVAKRRTGARTSITGYRWEATQNLLCAYGLLARSKISAVQISSW